MRYQFNKRFQAGTSMVYVLAALIVTGFIGGAMIRMMGSERTANALYATSASARNAAKSGIIAALHRFEDGTSWPINKLQTWINNPVNSPLWVVGNESGGTPIYDQINSDHKYRTKLIAFDEDNFNITLMSEGIGKGGARATVTAVYYLDGLEYATKPQQTQALYLGSGADEIRAPLHVKNGDTFMDGAGKFVNEYNTFEGVFRRDAGSSTDQLMLKSTHFKKAAFFIDGKVTFGGNLSEPNTIFEKGFGGGADFTTSGNQIIEVKEKGAFLNGEFGTNASGKHLKFSSAVTTELLGLKPISKYVGGSLGNLYRSAFPPTVVNAVDDSIDVPSKLNIPTDNPPELKVDLTGVKAHPNIINYTTGLSLNGISKTSLLTGEDLNDLYDNNTANLYNEWLIVRLMGQTGGRYFTKGGAGFSRKMILLVEDVDVEIGTDMFESSTSGNTFLYIGSDKQVKQFGGCKLFRGFIYANSTANGPDEVDKYALVMKSDLPTPSSLGMEVKGSIYSVGTATYRMEGNDKLTVTYDQDVLDEIAMLTVFKDPAEKKKLTLKTTHTNIIASLVSQSL